MISEVMYLPYYLDYRYLAKFNYFVKTKSDLDKLLTFFGMFVTFAKEKNCD